MRRTARRRASTRRASTRGPTSRCGSARPRPALDPAARTVTLDGGDTLPWDRLLIATGAEPRALPVPGGDLPGVLTLRTLDDSDRLRDVARSGGRLVVIGAGWIGCEAAASARELGAEVTWSRWPTCPWPGSSGRGSAASTPTCTASTASSCSRARAWRRWRATGAPSAMRLAGGRTIDCAAVLAGVGVVPRTALAESAGLAVDNGILVDATLETGAPGVFAAGDVANALHPFYDGRRVRVEHWANALNQGPCAARNMLGAGEPYDRLPYFFSDQYDAGMEYSGLASADDEVVIRGDAAGARADRVLGRGGTRPGRHEPERLGRERRGPGAHPLPGGR